jgi:hypothetical protein
MPRKSFSLAQLLAGTAGAVVGLDMIDLLSRAAAV